jgi:hypothetical protein
MYSVITFKPGTYTHTKTLIKCKNLFMFLPLLLALPTKARILLCFRFIIEYGRKMDFGPYNNRSILILGFFKGDILACVET